jgi:hypothetical protein
VTSRKNTPKHQEATDLDLLKQKYLERKSEYEQFQVTHHVEYKKIVRWLKENDTGIS